MRFFFFVCLLCQSWYVSAQYSYLYFQNNTHLDFQFNTEATNGLSNDNWDGNNGTIGALEAGKELLRVKRLFGFSGTPTDYETIAHIKVAGSNTNVVSCKLRVTELLGSTTLKQSAANSSFSDPFYYDRDLHSHIITISGIEYRLRYAAYSTAPGGTYDDVLFAIDYVDPPKPYIVPIDDVQKPAVLNVMAYNLYMRPTILFPDDDQATRAQFIHKGVQDMDVLMLEEVFDDAVRDDLLANLAAEYPYQSTVIGNPSSPLEDGGVLIVSRWPIEVQDQYLWGSDCVEDDCLADKGIKYVRINKLGTKYHLFATHMDAFNKYADVEMRKVQLTKFKQFVDSQNIPADEAVIMGGDLNVDKFSNKWGEYDSLWTDHFKATMPTYSGHYATWDKEHNYYLTDETDAPEYLDYIMTRYDHLPVISNNNNVVVLRSLKDEMFRIFELSDHFAVWARLEFPCTSKPIVNGDATPCSQNTSTYSVTAGAAGTTYEWTAIGGTIVAGQGTPNVSVVWDNGVTGTVQVMQTNP
ncbi:MAG: sphingomyelin phosphodiesterase [Chitinophagales bacterium]|nr:sphingomyelin phosphodiesterase [Chitinophagales bacterium]